MDSIWPAFGALTAFGLFLSILLPLLIESRRSGVPLREFDWAGDAQRVRAALQSARDGGETHPARRVVEFALAPALTVRSGMHGLVMVAACDDAENPEQRDAELTLRSPFVDVAWPDDLSARALTFTVGLGALAGGVHTLTWPGPQFVTTLGQLYVLAQVTVLLIDPLGFVLVQTQERTLLADNIR